MIVLIAPNSDRSQNTILIETQSANVVLRKLQGDEGIHPAVEFAQGSALSWVVGELAVAISDIAQRLSIPRNHALSGTLESRLRPRLLSLMTDQPCRTYHNKLNHYWPQFQMQEVSGEVNIELYVTNHRFRGCQCQSSFRIQAAVRHPRELHQRS